MEFKRQDNFLIAVMDDDSEVPFCQAVYAKTKYIDLFKGDQSIEYVIHTSELGEVPFEVERGTPGRNLVRILRRKGLIFPENDEYEKKLSEFLTDSEAEAEISVTYRKLGFHSLDGVQVYLAHHPLGGIDSKKKVATYYRPEITEPCGTMRGWRKCIRSCVLGRPYLELALSMSGLAPISHILREANLVHDVPVISVIGQSSTGKTDCLRTLGSVYGKPTVGNGMIRNMHTTQTGFYAQLGNTYGYPAIWDETTTVHEWDFTGQVYLLPTGQNKVRCDSSGEVVSPSTFSGAIFLSGERSLFEQTIGTAGLNARLLELTLPWTTGQRNAECLELGLCSNYGHAVYPLINFITGHTKWIKERYMTEYHALLSSLKPSTGVDNRILKVHAQIIVSAEVVSKALQLPLNIEGIRNVLKCEFKKPKHNADKIEEAYATLKTYILNNQSKFASNISRSMITSSALGYIGMHQGKDAVWLPKKTFENKIQQETNVDLNEISRELSKRGYLYRDSGRHYYTLQKFGPVSLDCYILYLSDDKNSNNNPNKVTKSKLVKNDIKNKLNKSKSQMHSLLEEDDED